MCDEMGNTNKALSLHTEVPCESQTTWLVSLTSYLFIEHFYLQEQLSGLVGLLRCGYLASISSKITKMKISL